MQIIYNSPVNPDTWDNIVSRSNQATYFQTRQWAEIWQVYTKGTLNPAARYIKFSDGQEVVFPMSSSRVTKGLLTQYYSAPAWAFGGWVSPTLLSNEHHLLLWNYARQHDLILRQNPYDTTLAQTKLPWNIQDFTQTMDLRRGLDIYKALWQQNGVARKVRKAQKTGVSIQTAETLAEWQEYFKVYQASQQRWGQVIGMRFEWKLFELFFMHRSQQVRLYVAKKDNKIISGALCFYHNKHVAYWHGAALEEYFEYRPVNLLHCSIIEQAVLNGYWWYDFGTSANLEGLIKFKQSFGAEKLTSNVVTNKGLLRKVIDEIKTTTNKVLTITR